MGRTGLGSGEGTPKCLPAPLKSTAPVWAMRKVPFQALELPHREELEPSTSFQVPEGMAEPVPPLTSDLCSCHQLLQQRDKHRPALEGQGLTQTQAAASKSDPLSEPVSAPVTRGHTCLRPPGFQSPLGPSFPAGSSLSLVQAPEDWVTSPRSRSWWPNKGSCNPGQKPPHPALWLRQRSPLRT